MSAPSPSPSPLCSNRRKWGKGRREGSRKLGFHIFLLWIAESSCWGRDEFFDLRLPARNASLCWPSVSCWLWSSRLSTQPAAPPGSPRPHWAPLLHLLTISSRTSVCPSPFLQPRQVFCHLYTWSEIEGCILGLGT